MYFETIKCENYQIFNLDYHNKRVQRTISKNFDLKKHIQPINNKLLKCKIIYDKNRVLSVDYFEYKKPNIKSFKIVYDDKICYYKKYLHRKALKRLFEQRELCDEIMIFKHNLLTDTFIANIAILYNNKWLTPKLPLLKGTTRQRYLDTKFIKEENITLDMLKKASKIALLNAMLDFKILENYSLFS